VKGQSLVDYLRVLANRDPGAVAALRRSLAFAPGAYAPAFPALERLVGSLPEKERERAYLVSGLWARYGKREVDGLKSLATLMRKLAAGSDSVATRFTVLLDADVDELPHRLRQAISLAHGAGLELDWAALYDDLRWWEHPDKTVQQRWARQFYASSESADEVASAK
jgi:CRISPR system Cascade subunit CasB